MSNNYLERREWSEFKESGLVWFINRLLHLFGWAIVMEVDGEKITSVYPARCRFRGFYGDTEDDGFRRLTKHLSERWPEIIGDLDDTEP